MAESCNNQPKMKLGPPIKKVSFLEILEKRKKHRESIKGIKNNFLGHCIHVGKISYGCKNCYTSTKYNFSESLGTKCNLNCKYCLGKKNLPEKTEAQIDDKIAMHYRNSLNPDYGKVGPQGFAFTMGEPLLYIDRMEKYMKALKEIEKNKGTNPYYKVYTNGTLANKKTLKRLKKIGIMELRFHPSASNFSEVVYKNMEEAVKMGFIVAVEEPAYPKHREGLFKMLPRIDKIGVKHLQMCVVEVYDYNIGEIYSDYPEGLFFHDYHLHLYDEGLTYDIMKEVLDKKYKFSVLDCSPETHRHSHSISKRAADAVTEKDIEETIYDPWSGN